MEGVTPEVVLEQLKKQSSKRGRATLDAIFAVCKEQQETGQDHEHFLTIPSW